MTTGGVTAPRCFQAAGIAAQIKPNKKDMALIFSERPAAVAGVFTTNRIQAAPVLFCRELLRGRTARAILINSGNANACTGETGRQNAQAMSKLAAELLAVEQSAVFVCSTGTIGRQLPMDKITNGIRLLVPALAADGGDQAAEAIMTTDTRSKQAAAQLDIEGRLVTIGGMAKGAGMINPNMATLLVFITTDAEVEPMALQTALAKAVDESLNRISVDGDRSTNDTVLCLANGAAGNTPLKPGHPRWRAFRAALNAVAGSLARQIVQDAEGATKLVHVTVKGAFSRRAAKLAAEAVGKSLLVKTSWFGSDPNWGRVICAVGYSGAPVQPDAIDIAYNGKLAVRGGQSAGLPEAELHQIIAQPEFNLEIDLHQGKTVYTMMACDCSEEYVRINAAYMT